MHTINPGLLPMLLHPMSQTDVFIVAVFLCLPTFNFCVFWYCLIIKLNVPQVLSNRLNIFTIVSTTIPPSTHMLCVCVVCVCFCVFMLHIFSLLSMKTMLLIWLQLSTNPYSSKTNCQFSILMTIAFSLVQRSGIGSHHIYCDKISCFQLKNRVCFDLSS